MTVCIAAIAAESKAIVCIADRALTYAGYAANSERDNAIAKIVDLPGNWCAMFSCDSLTFPKRVLDLVATVLSGKTTVTLAEMETAAKSAYETCWWNEIEDHILKPILLSKSDFIARKSDLLPLDAQLVMKLAKEMSEYKQVCSMIFCGFEGDTPHLFTAHTPVDIDPADWEGFAVVGSGLETARNQMLWSRYSKEDSLQSVLYDVFNAKVATEVLQTIGYAWNWRIIVPGKKPVPLPVEIDKLIDKLWIEYSYSPFSEKSRTLPATVEGWRKKVRAFSATALAKEKTHKARPSTSRKSKGQP